MSTLTRVAEILAIPESFVVTVVEAGIVEMHDGVELEHVVERVRVSWCLQEELGVNIAGIEVALHLLSVIDRDRRILGGR